jgi:hypothetical protein
MGWDVIWPDDFLSEEIYRYESVIGCLVVALNGREVCCVPASRKVQVALELQTQDHQQQLAYRAKNERCTVPAMLSDPIFLGRCPIAPEGLAYIHKDEVSPAFSCP